MEKIVHKVLLIGLGYHARRIHLPAIKEMGSSVVLSYVVDIIEEKNLIERYLKDQRIQPGTYFLRPSEYNSEKAWKTILNNIVEEHNIDTVLIATEPLSHYRYVMWALERGIHILLDKPISTAEQIANSPKIAKQNLREYEMMEKKYRKVLKKKNLVFTVLAQRRFHPVFDIAREAINKVFVDTNCPITMQSSLHCDGQWRFPDEIIEQNYHPYNSGYGKLSHSGYHSLDVMAEFTGITHKGDKYVDNIEVYAQGSRPADFMAQLNLEDHKRFFQDSDDHFKYGNEYKSLMRSFGEIDVTASIAFKQKKQTITLGTLNLAHTGYGQRNWASAKDRDLYKGNGRVRQEQYVIEQGPFQSIFINSYQSKEILSNEKSMFDIGGEHHLEVIIFRNDKIYPSWKALEVYNVKDIVDFRVKGYSRGHQEEARRSCIFDFFSYIDKDISVNNQRSNFLDHRRTAILFSSIYLSLALARKPLGSQIVRTKI